MTHVEITVSGSDWSLSWASHDGPATIDIADVPLRALVGPLQAEWATESLPPVSQPSTVAVQIYDNGLDVGGFLPVHRGDPIAVYVVLDDTHTVIAFQGRIADLSAVNHPAGGVVFRLICADHLASLALQGAPALFETSVPSGGHLFALYGDLAQDAAIAFDFHAGESWNANVYDIEPTIDFTNVSTLEALTRAVLADIRVDPTAPADNTQASGINPRWGTITRYLTVDIDQFSAVVDDTPAYRLNEYDWRTTSGLAGLLELLLVDGVYMLAYNEDYYLTHTAIVLDASQLLRDVGEWRQLAAQTINAIELQGNYETAVGSGVFVQSVRRTFSDLVAAYGPNTRSLTIPMQYREGAGWTAEALLGDRSQIELGYGFEALTIAWDQVPDAAKDAWAEGIWPMFDTDAPGRPVGIIGIPDHWRLADGPAVFGRLMGVSWTIEGSQAVAQLAVRAVAPVTPDSITFAGIDTYAPDVTFANIDPTIRIVDAYLLED